MTSRTKVAGLVAATIMVAGAMTMPATASPPEIRESRVLRPLRTADRNTAPVLTALAVAPDGSWVSAGDDHRIRVWASKHASAPLRTLAGHQDWIRTAVFAADGALLATAGDDRRVILWDVGTGTPKRELAQQPAAIYAVAFSPDGRLLATVGFEPYVRLYEVATGRPVRTFSAGCKLLAGIAFSAAANRLWVGGRDGKLIAWALDSGDRLHTIPAHQRRIRALAMSPDGTQLASVGDAGVVSIISTHDGRTLLRTAPVAASLRSVVWTGPSLVAAGVLPGDLWRPMRRQHHQVGPGRSTLR